MIVEKGFVVIGRQQGIRMAMSPLNQTLNSAKFGLVV
jgi:hypothetical protein